MPGTMSRLKRVVDEYPHIELRNSEVIRSGRSTTKSGAQSNVINHTVDRQSSLIKPVTFRDRFQSQKDIEKAKRDICYKPPESNREPSVRPRALILQPIVRQKS